MAKTPVELHVVSDSTGETATRLVHALEAQFPDQEFEEIRHPRVETVDHLRLAVERAKGRSAVVVYTLVEPELREQMRVLCRRSTRAISSGWPRSSSRSSTTTAWEAASTRRTSSWSASRERRRRRCRCTSAIWATKPRTSQS